MFLRKMGTKMSALSIFTYTGEVSTHFSDQIRRHLSFKTSALKLADRAVITKYCLTVKYNVHTIIFTYGDYIMPYHNNMYCFYVRS